VLNENQLTRNLRHKEHEQGAEASFRSKGDSDHNHSLIEIFENECQHQCKDDENRVDQNDHLASYYITKVEEEEAGKGVHNKTKALSSLAHEAQLAVQPLVLGPAVVFELDLAGGRGAGVLL